MLRTVYLGLLRIIIPREEVFWTAKDSYKMRNMSVALYKQGAMRLKS